MRSSIPRNRRRPASDCSTRSYGGGRDLDPGDAGGCLRDQGVGGNPRVSRSPSLSGGRCPGSWEAVHGHIEPEERPADAARREMEEETGLTPDRLYNLSRVEAFYQERFHPAQVVEPIGCEAVSSSISRLAASRDVPPVRCGRAPPPTMLGTAPAGERRRTRNSRAPPRPPDHVDIRQRHPDRGHGRPVRRRRAARCLPPAISRDETAHRSRSPGRQSREACLVVTGARTASSGTADG